MNAYLVGIDLGTSNTVLAYARAGEDAIRVLPIAQLVAPGAVAERALLPSLRYHPAPGELAPGDVVLPWTTADPGGVAGAVVGTLARELGAQVPGRQVASAKSWLSHPGVDRTAAILPWGAPEAVAKVSPMAASASYLAHLRAAWNQRFPAAPLERQEIVLTVPASFDDGARALTVEAARQAGLPTLRLLEEPQAAFYDWLFHHRDAPGAALAQAQLVLVCDVGGGTTDFTLIEVERTDDGPRLTRIGVGDHLMLGGDNMDLALAHLAERRLAHGAPAAAPLGAAAFSQLVQRCRGAKELLLAADAPVSAAVTLLGAGARLVGAARSTTLGREEVEHLVVDGFFPLADDSERPQRRRGGLVEFGLPYPADPAISRHLAAFLDRHAVAARRALGPRAPAEGALPVPDAVLLNGGVFRAHALAARLVDVLTRWRGAPPTVLHNDDPDVAVARGAVAYALARQRRGLRIGGGSARSYFLVVDDDRAAARGVCVLARGTEAGQAVPLPGRSFALRLGRPVRFHLVSSVGDAAYRAGELVELGSEGFVRLPPVATVIPATAGGRDEVSVALETAVTEIGTLEMRCITTADPGRSWQLEFQLRGEGAGAAQVEDTPARLPARYPDAVDAVERVFGSRSTAVEAKEVKRLRGQLEHLLGKRDDWDSAVLRALFDVLWQRARRRRRSAEHERVWLNLAGFCVRPGLGYPLDAWRVEQLWTLFEQGLQYVRESQNWSEWWTLWRRAAGGLAEAAQLRLLEAAAAGLQAEPPRRRPPSPMQGAHDDMLRLAASLERVPVEYKLDFGEWLLERLLSGSEKAHGWWALGRVGAREPLYGSSHNVVPAETAGRWLDAILALDWKKVEPAAFAAAQIARMTGDRGRDLPPPVREAVAHRLEASSAPASWIAMVQHVAALEEADERRAFGESLPPGLKLIEG